MLSASASLVGLCPVMLYRVWRDDQSAVLCCLACDGVRSRAWLERLGLAGLESAGREPRCKRTTHHAPGTFATIVVYDGLTSIESHGNEH